MTFNDTTEPILYIEDNADDIFYFKYVLNKIDKSIQLISVDNGEEAIDVLSENNNYRLIFLDIKLPKFNAFEILGALKSADKVVPIDKIIILTTSTSENDMRSVQELGIKKFLFKPISESTLRSFIETHSN